MRNPRFTDLFVIRRLCLISLALAACSSLFGQSTVAVPSTGKDRQPTATVGIDKDYNWKFIQSSITGQSSMGQAFIVYNLPGGWKKAAAFSEWIGPDADQTNAKRPGTCCQGESSYQVTFDVADPATAVVKMMVAADDAVTIWLNYVEGGGAQDEKIVYSTVGPTYDAPVSVTVKQGATYVDPGGNRHIVKFNAGMNSFVVQVLNYGGGPTGLYINVEQPQFTGPTSYTDSAPADGSALATTDPVDSGSGQFYDVEADFNLGGPMQLGFQRYYSSQFAKSGSTSALGANWMGSYDVSALVNSTKAQVLLFRGRVVSFVSAAGGWQLVSPLSTGYQFASVTGGFKFMDPKSNRIYTFSTSGALVKIEDRNGNAINVMQGVSGPVKVADGLGRSLDFTYASGQLASVKDQSGRTLTFTYTNGLLATATDPLKAVTNYAYTTVGTSKALLTKETLPLGNAPVSQVYDANGRVTAQTDGNNNTTKIAYDAAGTTTITDAGNGVTRHKNDSIGDIAEVTDPLGGAASVTYDSANRRTGITDKAGGRLTYTYHTQTGQISSITDALGNTTTYSYSAQPQGPFTFYNRTGINYPDKTAASMTYDPVGNLLTTTMPGGGVKKFTYDSLGRVSKSIDETGQSTSFVWNADGTIASQTDAMGNASRYEYDALKKLAKLTDPNGSTASYFYDGDGRRIAGARPGETNWTAHFDANGQKDSLVNPLGARSVFAYTPTGKIASSTDALKNVTSYSYDKLDRLTKIQNGAGESVTYVYDAAGRVVSTTDNSGLRFSQVYDAEGRVLRRTDGSGRTSLYSYDKAGRPAILTSPAGNQTQFSYDARGKLLSTTNALGEQAIETYDAMGRLMSVTGPGGAATAFQRDVAGRPISFTSATGSVWTMSYDAIGRLNALSDPLGNQTNYAYSGTSRSKVSWALGSASYTYDKAGRPIKIEYSDGSVVGKSYDALGLLTAANGVEVVRNLIGLPTKMNGIAISLDGAGKPLNLTYAAGKGIAYTYDKSGRVNSVTDWTGGSTAITYDGASRRLSLTYPNTVATTYGYDPDGRRNSIVYGSLGTIQLMFDAAGKTTAADRNLPLAPTLRDEAKQFSYVGGGQLTSSSYDAMGRVTAQDTRAYNWNLATQLVGFADSTASATFTYDGLGEMNSSSASGTAQSYVFNHTMKYPALSIVRQDGNDLLYYVYLPDGELLYSIEAATGERRFYHFDEMGNTVFLTDNSGGVTDSYAITPYGDVADHTGASVNPFTWQGQYGVIQEGAGLYYMRSRHYDASTARFLSPDPMMNAEPQSSEPYAYAKANPLLYRDSFGSDASLPTDIGDLYSRFGLLFVPFAFGGVSPDQFAQQLTFLSVAVVLVQANPELDFNYLIQWAALITGVLPSAPAPQSSTCEIVRCTMPEPPGLSSSLDTLAGASLIAQDGGTLITNDGGTLITNDGGTAVSDDGASAISDNGAGFVPETRAYSEPRSPVKSKNRKN